MGPTQRPDALRSAGRAARASVMLPSVLLRRAVGQGAGVAGERWLATAGSPAAGARADTPPVAREAASRARGVSGAAHGRRRDACILPCLCAWSGGRAAKYGSGSCSW